MVRVESHVKDALMFGEGRDYRSGVPSGDSSLRHEPVQVPAECPNFGSLILIRGCAQICGNSFTIILP